MAKPLDFLKRLWFGEQGATMVEYVLLLMFVAMACFTAVTLFGQSLVGPFQSAKNGLS